MAWAAAKQNDDAFEAITKIDGDGKKLIRFGFVCGIRNLRIACV